MYFIINDYSTHIIYLPDVRNVMCGFEQGCYRIFIYFKGDANPISVAFYDRERRDKTFNELCDRLLGKEVKSNEPRELLACALEQLYLLGYDTDFTNDEVRKLTTDIRNYLEETQ